ncbi:MAG: hypothetical protein J3Q66DRAFT_155612, partial [Benniella sp.]
IARYLDFAALKVCSLVCKAWYLDFHPLLWEWFTHRIPKSHSGPPEAHAAWVSIISKKAQFFRHIQHKEFRRSISPTIRDTLLDRCHGLITIEAFITGGSTIETARYWEGTLRPLIERNKTSLRRLQLRESTQISMTTLQLPSLLAGLSSLQSLELELGAMSTLEDLPPILDACSTSLARLDLHTKLQRRMANQGDSAADQDNSLQSLVHQTTTTISPLRLKHLGIHGTCHEGTLEYFFSHVAFHSLESLQVVSIDGSQFSQVPPTLRDTLSRLTELHINSVRKDPDQRESHAPFFLALLGAIPPHQLRKVRLNAMETECIDLLIEQQHQSLESLNVFVSNGHEEALGDILATCRKLKSLNFGAEPKADIRTLVDPQRPWVCTELEVFEGYFGLYPPPPPLASNANNDAGRSEQMDEETDEKGTISDPVTSSEVNPVEDLFMRRLGQLTKLRRLVQSWDSLGHLFGDYPDYTERETMAWALSSGLRHLVNLADLQWIEFSDLNLPAGIGIPELVFIKQHWPSLKGLSCYKLNAVEVHEWLATEWPELQVRLKQRLFF